MRQACSAIGKDGQAIGFPSILAAAEWVESHQRSLGKQVARGGCAGNICRALKVGGMAYGWKWAVKEGVVA